jgi:hypothetical protein
MSRGLGRIEQAIIDILEDEEAYYFNDPSAAEDLAIAIYHSKGPTRPQRLAVLRAMHSVVRKYPDRYALAGGKGREPLWIGTHRAIVQRLGRTRA